MQWDKNTKLKNAFRWSNKLIERYVMVDKIDVKRFTKTEL